MNRTSVATGPQDAEVSRRIEPMGAQELSMMEAGEMLGMSERQFRRYRDRYEEEGLAGLHRPTAWARNRPRRVPAEEIEWMLRSIPDASHGLEREAFPRAHSRAAWFRLGLHLDQNTAAYGGAGGTRGATRGAPAQTAAQAVRGDDAASGRQPHRLAGRSGRSSI